jgi:hypothetical protein
MGTMKNKKQICLVLIVLAAFLLSASCATLQQMAAAMNNLLRLQFKVGLVHDFALNGINLGRKSSLADFNAMDGLRLVQAFATKRFPAEIVLDIEAVNPNDGRGGSRQTVSTLTSLESRLLIDGVPTVWGNIDRPIEIPGTGQASVIPLRMSIDLYKFFGDKGYEGVLNLALAIGGLNRDASRISLDAQPRVTTPIGPMTYPGRLTIVSHEFR